MRNIGIWRFLRNKITDCQVCAVFPKDQEKHVKIAPARMETMLTPHIDIYVNKKFWKVQPYISFSGKYGGGGDNLLKAFFSQTDESNLIKKYTFCQKSTRNRSIKHKLFIIHPNLFYRLHQNIFQTHFPDSTSVAVANSLLCIPTTENGCLEVVI